MTVYCRTCIYWEPPSKAAYAVAEKRGSEPFGQCQFNPPSIVRLDAGFRGMWPTTGATQWCREHAVVVDPVSE